MISFPYTRLMNANARVDMGAGLVLCSLETAREAVPDLILLDIKMPGIDGFETLKRLRGEEATSQIPVVFLSAHANVDSIEEAEKLGAQGYLTKPIQFDQVLEKVKAVLS